MLRFRRPGDKNRRWTSLLHKLWSGTLTKLLKGQLEMKECVGHLASGRGSVVPAGFTCMIETHDALCAVDLYLCCTLGAEIIQGAEAEAREVHELVTAQKARCACRSWALRLRT